MNGVILLAHGSKMPETEKKMNDILLKLKNKLDTQYIKSAFLRFSNSTLEKCISQFIEQGITSIKIIPMFIFKGQHIIFDIPKQISALENKYPNIIIQIEDYIGNDNLILDILIKKIKS